MLSRLPSQLVVYNYTHMTANLQHSRQQAETTFQEVTDTIYTYMKERDWDQQPSRSLAISIALEAGELLEHFQWSDKSRGTTDEIAAELADILIYAFHFAIVENIDIPGAMMEKLEKQAKKYPAKKFKGKAGKQRNDAWLKAKLSYKKDGL